VNRNFCVNRTFIGTSIGRSLPVVHKVHTTKDSSARVMCARCYADKKRYVMTRCPSYCLCFKYKQRVAQKIASLNDKRQYGKCLKMFRNILNPY